MDRLISRSARPVWENFRPTALFRSDAYRHSAVDRRQPADGRNTSSIREIWKRSTFGTLPNEISPDAQTHYELSQRLTRMASAAWVRLIASSDSAGGTRLPGFTGIDELILFVEAGVTPLEALRAGTLYPAILLDMEDSLGTVEAGKLADLVLPGRGSSLTEIRNLRRVAAVVADVGCLRLPRGRHCSTLCSKMPAIPIDDL